MNRLSIGKWDAGGDKCDQTGRGKEKKRGGGGREGGVPPSPHHATLGTCSQATVCFTCLDDYES